VDSAIVLAWVVRECDADVALDLLDRVYVHKGVAPRLWRLEIANGLLSATRQRRLKSDQIAQVVANITEIPIEIDRRGDDLAWTRVVALAERHGLTAYDAAYLELATRRGCVIATLDRALAKAAANEGVLVLSTALSPLPWSIRNSGFRDLNSASPSMECRQAISRKSFTHADLHSRTDHYSPQRPRR
jgi:predicted nucleic acid-binding protein